jgi:hypothetical protein
MRAAEQQHHTRPRAGGERDGLQACSFSRPAIGISRKLIAVNSLIEEQCLHGLGGHPFRDLSGARGFPSIIGCRLGRYVSAPSPKKRLLPFHFVCPVVPPWSPASGVHDDIITLLC